MLRAVKMNKMSQFLYMTFAGKIPFCRFWGHFPALKVRVSGLDPNTTANRIEIDIYLKTETEYRTYFKTVQKNRNRLNSQHSTQRRQ